MNIWKKYKEWIVLTLFCLLAGTVIFLASGYLSNKIQNSSDEIQKKIIDTGINNAKISKLPEMKSWHDSFFEKGESISVVLRPDDEVEFIKRLEFLSDETGNLISLQIEDEDQKKKETAKKNKEKNEKDSLKNSLPHDKYLTVSVILEGSYDQLLNFIHKLENMNYYVNILSIDSERVFIEDEKNSPFGNPSARGRQSEAPAKEKKVRTILTLIVYLAK